jgi:hypothetical protein
MYIVTLKRVRVTIVPVEIAKYYIFRVSTALLIQHTMRMCRILICGLSGSTVFFPHSHKRHELRRGGKKKLLNTNCVFWCSLQLLSETFLILRRTQRDTITNAQTPSRKVPVILVGF